MEKEGSPVSGKLSLRNSAGKNVKSNFFTGNNNNNYNNVNNNNTNNVNKSPFTFRLTRIDNFKLKDCLKEVQCEEAEGQKKGFEGISPDLDERRSLFKMQEEEKTDDFLEYEEQLNVNFFFFFRVLKSFFSPRNQIKAKKKQKTFPKV